MSNFNSIVLYKKHKRPKDKKRKSNNDNKFVLFLHTFSTISWKKESINISTTSTHLLI